MRRLLADSGSTKTDWVVISKNISPSVEPATYSGRGLNPHILSVEEIEDEMDRVALHLGRNFDEIRFYGAGVGNTQMVGKISDCLANVFECSDVVADSDMAGAARAVLGSRPGIACIMGTGSNSCHYNGSVIDRKSVSLGYILDDCGGGVAFGRRLLSDVFKGIAPDAVVDEFFSCYRLTPPQVVDRLYSQPGANKWIAGFMPFIVSHISDPYISAMVGNVLETFLEREFCCYPEWQLKEEGIGFVGSVAFLLGDHLRDALGRRGWMLRDIVRRPLDRLMTDNYN